MSAAPLAPIASADGLRTAPPADPLLDGLRARDPGAERAFYERHVDRTYRLCLRMTGREDLAQECTQDTFVRAFDRVDAFRGEAALSTWLHAIAVSVVLNALRRLRRDEKRHTDLDVVDIHHATRAPVEPDLRDRLQEAIAALPLGYRTVFLMHDVEGFTHEDIAASLGVAIGTSKAQLFHARRKLRVALAPYMAQEAR